MKPEAAEAHSSLAAVLMEKARLDEAIKHCKAALLVEPDFADAHCILANALREKGRMSEAIDHYRQAFHANPSHAAARFNLGLTFAKMKEPEKAIAQYQQALQIRPDYIGPLNNLAWELATASKPSLRNGPEAVKYASQANELTGWKNPSYLDTLAAAYAEDGRFSEAVRTARRALELAEQQSDASLADALRREIALYEAGQPFRIGP